MTKNTIKNILTAAVLATGTLAGSMSTAHADLTFGVFTQVDQAHNKGKNRGHNKHNKHNNGGYQTHNQGINFNSGYGGYYAPSYAQPVLQVHQTRHNRCHPRRAVRIAYNRFGLNQPYVKRINHKKIVVRGYSYGHPAKIVFKRTRHGCKVIATRGLY